MESPGHLGNSESQQPERSSTGGLPTPPDISGGLEQFEGQTPLQIARALVPNLPDDQLAGFLIGLGLNLEVPVPEWAKAASEQFWKYFVGTNFDPLNSPQHAGILFGLAEGMATSPPLQEPNSYVIWLKNALAFFIDAGSKEAQKFPPQEAAKFFIGRAKSAAVVERMKNPDYLKMIKRAPIYLSVAVCWKRFESFTSQAEAERWLRAEKVISENVDEREVRATFTVIGLKYRGPGRPKNVKTGRLDSSESGLSFTDKS